MKRARTPKVIQHAPTEDWSGFSKRSWIAFPGQFSPYFESPDKLPSVTSHVASARAKASRWGIFVRKEGSWLSRTESTPGRNSAQRLVDSTARCCPLDYVAVVKLEQNSLCPHPYMCRASQRDALDANVVKSR